MLFRYSAVNLFQAARARKLVRTMMMNRATNAPPGFRPVPRTGVIYVMTEAGKHGYKPGGTEWANLGQGAPETGPLPDAPERLTTINLNYDDLEYAPIDGLPKLRQAVADLYNERYRKGKHSQYTFENVAISAGGRLAVTRAVSTLGRTHVGHFLPDYTAYEELLDAFGTFAPIPILLDRTRNYEFTADELREEILGRGLSALLLSNPCNPTGKVIHGETLASWVNVSRETQCTIIFDEFYSHYLYLNGLTSLSAASSVEDVNEDPVVIIDGLTKNWRYPGFRVSWTVGPRSVIEGIASAGSFLDGGCARPMQIAALQLVKKELADREAHAIQASFGEKRTLLLAGLAELGILVEPQPQGGFYCWGDVEKLPASMNTSMSFFHKAIDAKVITVPGVFFDINPGQRRANRPSRFEHYVRFSFGPSMPEIERGLSSLRKIL